MQTKKSIIPYEGALLNPRRDATFKALFGGESTNARFALKSFLEAVLEANIENIQLAPNELPGDSEDEKQPRFDLTCTIDGEKVNVEMQTSDTFLNYANRVEYYVAHLLNHYSPRGMHWKDVPKVYQVSVLNFFFDQSSPAAVSQYQMRTEDGRRLNRRMNVFILELPKMGDDPLNIETLTPVERWCTFLKYADDPEKADVIKTLCSAEAGIMAASTVLSEISQDEAAWLAEFARDVAERDHMDLIATLEEKKAALAETEAALAEKAAALIKKDSVLAEKDSALAEKDIALAEKDSALAEKDTALAEKEAELEQLRAQLAALQSKIK